MNTQLFSVFERQGEQVGIEEFGETRTLIHVSGGSLVETKKLQLHDLGSHIADLNRTGFLMKHSGAFFDEGANCFAKRHPDFNEKSYFAFIREEKDVQAAVARIEAIGLRNLQGTQREVFKDWLRSLDLSENYLVASNVDPAFVLALSEYAYEKSLCIYTAYPGLPASKPSDSKLEWLAWLKNHFGDVKVDETYATLWPSKAYLPTSHGTKGNPNDLLSYAF